MEQTAGEAGILPMQTTRLRYRLLGGAQLTANDGVYFLEYVALGSTISWKQLAYAIRDSIQHRFEFGDYLCGAGGVIGKFYGMAPELRKQPDISGRYQIRAMNSLVTCLYLIAQQCMKYYGRAFPSEETNRSRLLRENFLAVQVGEVREMNGIFQNITVGYF